MRQRQPWLRDPKHLDWIATLPCLACSREPCDPAHVRLGTDGAMARQPSDCYVVPLCHGCHMRQHGGERTFYRALKIIDPWSIAVALYRISGATEAARRLIFQARLQGRMEIFGLLVAIYLILNWLVLYG